MPAEEAGGLAGRLVGRDIFLCVSRPKFPRRLGTLNETLWTTRSVFCCGLSVCTAWWLWLEVCCRMADLSVFMVVMEGTPKGSLVVGEVAEG